MELIPVKYCVTIEIRNSKLNLVIIKPPRLLSNLGGSLQGVRFFNQPRVEHRYVNGAEANGDDGDWKADHVGRHANAVVLVGGEGGDQGFG